MDRLKAAFAASPSSSGQGGGSSLTEGRPISPRGIRTALLASSSRLQQRGMAAFNSGPDPRGKDTSEQMRSAD